MQAADALAHAHSLGVVHRDVKPSNLLLDSHGVLWVVDFGLAKADGQDDLTETGEMVGTLRYTPPEQFGGESDARSDVYSLGATLYELVTLLPAFVHALIVQRDLRKRDCIFSDPSNVRRTPLIGSERKLQ